MEILAMTETSMLGYHWQLEEIEKGQFWAALYFKGQFDSSTDKTSDKSEAERLFHVRRGGLTLLCSS